MTDLTEMYCLPVSCIDSPLLVIPDFKLDGSASDVNFLSVLPSHKMSLYFLNYIYSRDIDFELNYEEWVCNTVLAEQSVDEEMDDFEPNEEMDENEECSASDEDEEGFVT